ncbi:MAG: hypothetical protein ACE5RN_07395 [Nitrosopumilaceae archaeon]
MVFGTKKHYHYEIKKLAYFQNPSLLENINNSKLIINMQQQLSLFHHCPKDIKTKGRIVTDQTRGEIFCQKCGRVLKEKIDTKDNEKNVNFLELNYSGNHSEQTGNLAYYKTELFRGGKNS